ncbi:MAG: hypothetical protein HYS22_03980 [Deltaproteobacteria bacterium]|nr:hypothetical protein [Deltaproteobacteria bacterium]
MTKKKLEQIGVATLPALFEKIEKVLAREGLKIKIIVLGGLAIIAQGFRDRATLDIDIAPSSDAQVFEAVCNQLAIPVDIVTLATTVDFKSVVTHNIFTGKYLTMDAVTAPDLIKLKLERFYKQDPDDIYAILAKTKMPYEDFKALVLEMFPDFIGDRQKLILSAEIVVERIFPEQVGDFKMAPKSSDSFNKGQTQ